MANEHEWHTVEVPTDSSEYAPDGSEVRLLVRTARASAVHCTLPPGDASRVTKNVEIEEIWYFLEGRGELARMRNDRWDVVPVQPGTCVTIPPEVPFQFRSVGSEALSFLCVTIPPWPGPDANVILELPGAWTPSARA